MTHTHTHTHTHTNMHLTNNMASLTLNKHTYPSIQTKERPTRETLIIHLTLEKPYLKQNMAANISSSKINQTQNINMLQTLIKHL